MTAEDRAAHTVASADDVEGSWLHRTFHSLNAWTAWPLRRRSKDDLVEKAAQAFSAVDVDRVVDERLDEAATALIGAYLAPLPRRALDGVEGAVQDADTCLRRDAEGIKARTGAQALERMRGRLREILLLLSDDDLTSYAKLSSKLRQLQRPDLAREAASGGLKRSPRDPKALTTRAAAATHEGEYEAALADLRIAWEVAPKGHVATTAARSLRSAGRLTDALSMAEKAIDYEVTPYSVHAFVAAAVASGDEPALTHARVLLERVDDEATRGDRSDRWVLVLAARTLMRDGDLTRARGTLEEVLRQGSYGPAANALRRLEEVERREQLLERARDQHRPGGSGE